jgi:hypothetical protein
MFSLPIHRPFVTARWIFARVLGVVFFCAFASLGWQIRGLAGARGIVPAQPWLDAVWKKFGAAALWQFPTLCWVDASDGMLVFLCLAGVALSAVLIWGECFPGLCALLLWALYLSLCWVTNVFLGFQWDALLLETALLATVYLPWRWRPEWRRMTLAAEAARWLLWWLLFRLMFQSGVVKLASGDPTWHGLTALDYHFETQPLPIWTSWLAHQLLEWLLCISTFVMFVIEFITPLLIVASRRWRHGAAWALIALQLGIAATGNYAFFNLLTIGLCLLLFDDLAWPRWLRTRANADSPAESPAAPPQWAWWTTVAVLALVFLITVQPLLSSLGLVPRWPKPLAALRRAVAPLWSFNGYGLFAVMTTERHEIEVEGSNDGVLWRAYEFPWKPGDVRERPRLVAPHQPRLDWQMWFAALGTYRENPWFVQFLVRLLEGSPEVLGLMRTNPFPDRPPLYVRAVLYDYHFTRFGDDQLGWWKREPLGLYCPAITLQDGKPVAAP